MAADIFAGADPLDGIDVKQPAAEILKELGKIPNRYDGFFNVLNRASDKKNQKYPLMWPLTAGDIDNRLAFEKTVVSNGETKNLMVTDPSTNSNATDEYIWYQGDNAQIRTYSPSNPTDNNNYLSGWSGPLQKGMCNGRGGPPNEHGGAAYGPSCSNGCDNLFQYTTGQEKFSFATLSDQNICAGNNTMQGSPAILHCHDTTSDYLRNAFDTQVYGYANKAYPYIDITDPSQVAQSCKFKTDQEAFACCTSSGSDQIAQMCGPGFMPSAETQNSLCIPFMLALCETNWDQDACQRYLGSYKSNDDVRPVVQRTVANYINGIADRPENKCTYTDGPLKGQPGTNDYTSPAIGKMCKKADNTLRDDANDPFLSDSLFKLCSLDSGSSDGFLSTRDGICDNILNQYCAQFTRQDLQLDEASGGILMKLCGCHLAVPQQKPDGGCIGNSPPQTCLKYSSPNFPQGISTTVQSTQYPYPATPSQCDPICNQAGVIPNNQTCTETVCIMDNVNVQTIASSCGKGINITQVCAQGTKGKGTGNCYMSDVYVNSISSSCGGVFLNQNCNACFTYPEGEPWNAKQVPCCDPGNNSGGQCGTIGGGGDGGGGDDGGSGGSSSGVGFFSWLKEHALKVGGAIMVLGLLIMMIGIIIYYTEDVGYDVRDAGATTEIPSFPDQGVSADILFTE